jgi:predicted transcriptional regulator YdeE
LVGLLGVSEVEHANVVERGEVPVMFKRVADDQAAISRGWAEVEEAVGSLRGRKFYGVVDKASGEYRVCVAMGEADDPTELGLEIGTIPGGRYARVRLTGDPPAVYELIAPTFKKLVARPDRDPSRPEIEFYRRRDVIDLLLPVT